MGKIKNAFAFVLKHNKVWFWVTLGVLVFVITISLIVTQVGLISSTFSLYFGGEREYLVSGDPSQYVRFKPDADLSNGAAALDAANKLNETINEEGVVLIKNDGDPAALPLLGNDIKVSVFGKSSVNLVYGGSGSGEKGGSSIKSLYDSLTAAGIGYNAALKSFYEDASKSGNGRGKNPGMDAGADLAGIATGETPRSSYDQVRSSYDGHKSAALVVFSRIGGEGWDLPRTMKTSLSGSTAVAGANADDHYLQLDNNERALLEEVNENFDKIVVVINSATPMELGFLDEAQYGIDAALWIGKPGATGIMALGRILKGTVNPSGRLVDTFARDFRQDPTWFNFGNNRVSGGNTYQNMSGAAYKLHNTSVPFVDYQEGIYVGYRYYETRGFEERKAVLAGNSSAGEEEQYAWYDSQVMYPFGYGLSYSKFEWSIANVSPANGSALTKDGEITVTVNVKNTGTVAGKDVVQLYYSAPYTLGGIEKSHVVLGAFGKTPLLASGETKPVELKLKVRDMASYDNFGKNANEHKVWELDEAGYTIFIGKNANSAWRDGALKVDYTVPSGGFVYDKDSATGGTVENRFDDVSNRIKDSSKYLSRENFAGTFPTSPVGDNSRRRVDQSFIDKMHYNYYMGSGDNIDVGKPWYTEEVPTFANREVKAENAIQLYEMVTYGEDGMPIVSNDESKWDKFMNQLTFNQAADLVGKGAFSTIAISSIGKRATIDLDGPAGFAKFMSAGSVETCFYASECVVAATWNTELARAMGNAAGNEALLCNTASGDGRPFSGWYAPAVNIHRSPFSGRNWEYYSEDGVLSGIMGANLVAGAKAKGVNTYVKHFALNDQESDRGGVATWASEQSMREIYLKAFEIVVKEGKTAAMMSSFNRIGAVWAGGSYELLTEVLRNEWGFKGMVISDYNTFHESHMNVNQMVRAGGDLNLYQDQCLETNPNKSIVNASHMAAVRKAAQNILYATAGSNIMNGVGDGVIYGYAWPYWVIFVLILNIVLPIGFAVWGFFAIRSSYKRKQAA